MWDGRAPHTRHPYRAFLMPSCRCPRERWMHFALWDGVMIIVTKNNNNNKMSNWLARCGREASLIVLADKHFSPMLDTAHKTVYKNQYTIHETAY